MRRALTCLVPLLLLACLLVLAPASAYAYIDPGTGSFVIQGIIAPSDRVVCILTGHQLKDSDVTVRYHSGDADTEFGNRPTIVDNDTDSILSLLKQIA